MLTIMNQDRDELFFDITEVRVRKHYFKEQFMCWNLYGYDNNSEEYLLGSFDDEAEAYSEMLKLHVSEDSIKHITVY
jgi:hypothetical protein